VRRDAYYEALRLPHDPDVFIDALREEMREALQTFNDGLPRNPGGANQAHLRASVHGRKSATAR